MQKQHLRKGKLMQVTGLKGFHLSLQQARLWTLQGESQVYRVQCALRIDGPFGLKAFQQAVQWTMSQHSILRTSFYHLPGKELPLQVIHPCVETDYMLIDGTNLLETTHNVQIQTYFAQMQREYVDLTRCPLLRIRFLRLAVHVHIILVSLPALCADETTLRLFVAEVSQRYSHALQGIPWQEVGEGPLQYADVAA
ncbi:MAG: hypothetical protein E6J34_22025, partial [Chloroflexi bacterium]